MKGVGFMNHMTKSNQFNRSLQRKNWQYLKDKLGHISETERTRNYSGKVFNELFLDEQQEEVVENRKKIAADLANIRWENKVKTLVSIVLTGMLVLFCLMNWWV